MDKNDSKGGCPVLAFQRMVSGKYKIRILWDLKDGPRRYGEIRTGLLRGAAGSAEIAPRMLSREISASRSRSCVTAKPPSMVEMWCEKNVENVPIWPKVPALRPLSSASSDSQLSSMK